MNVYKYERILVRKYMSTLVSLYCKFKIYNSYNQIF